MARHQESPTAFMNALNDYLRNLPEKKKNKRSILSHIDVNDPPSPASIQRAMQEIEDKHAQKPSMRIMRRVMNPVIEVLKGYYGVIDTLVQADPTPAMMIWGALKAVINGLGRVIDLFDKIKTELLSLTYQLQRLLFYDQLYGESLPMQECLFSSYKNVFRFWSRVDKECDRCNFNLILRAATPFSVKKLQSIIEDLKGDADQIDRLVPIVEGRLAKGERQDAEVERREAGIERKESKQERQEASAWRKQQQSDRVRSWLGEPGINESNMRRHLNNIGDRFGSTCDWLLGSSTFKAWIDGTSGQPILWLYAGPGCGKSTLCSRAVEHVENMGSNPAVSFQFFNFDDQRRTALRTAQTLAAQIFEQFWLRHQDVPENLCTQIQKSGADLRNVLDFIRLVIQELPSVYVFLDGLDEECPEVRWREACKIVSFLVDLTTSTPGTMRLWCSTQDRLEIREMFKGFLTIDMKDEVEKDVNNYLSQTIPGLDSIEVDEVVRHRILTELKSRAKGNFLWASRMVKVLREEVSSFDHMEQFIKDGLPKDLDEYYRRIFGKYELRERDLASKIFSFIAFAKRPLRLKELQEAIGIVSTRTPEVLKSKDILWAKPIQKLFAPLIEIEGDSEDPNDCSCRLFHGTVKDFLLKNVQIFGEGDMNHSGLCIHLISEITIANACLLYLSQHKYSLMLLKDSGQWFTNLGENTLDHQFLRYSAKYWDKHLDNVEGTQELFERVQNFLSSTNFQTTLQIQSLWVQAHFAIYTNLQESRNHKYLKRVFPRWLSGHSPTGCDQFAQAYRIFIDEWRFLLDADKDPHLRVYAGELDRCLWGALGPRNFLSSNRSRYTSFMLISGEGKEGEKVGPYYEKITSNGGEVRILQQLKDSSAGEDTLLFSHEVWRLDNGTLPTLIKTNVITATYKSTNWKTYEKLLEDSRVHPGSPKPVSLSPDFRYLRIGSQIFYGNGEGDYIKHVGLDATNNDFPAYYEEMTGRGEYLVLATRRQRPEGGEDKYRTGKAKKLGLRKNASKTNTTSQLSSAESSNEDDESSIIQSTEPSSDDFLDVGSADDSWSEGSTEPDGHIFRISCETSENESTDTSESDDISQSTSGSGSETAERESASQDVIVSQKQLLNESESEGANVYLEGESDDGSCNGGFIGFKSTSDEDVNLRGFDSSSDEEVTFRGAMAHGFFRKRSGMKSLRGSIFVYQLNSGKPIQIFQHTESLPVQLYGSPPAIHPSKSLIVWPLYGGRILFADFNAKSYFIRSTRPSRVKIRYVFMKCHFSTCGRFLHIASLEAPLRPATKPGKRSHNMAPLNISVSSYRLSNRKTTRSPPTLIHHVKLSLVTSTSDFNTKTPCRLTWAPNELYISSSIDYNQLTIFRIGLFKPLKEANIKSSLVLIPNLPTFLPDSARARGVRYFPPRTRGACATVFIGSRSITLSDRQKYRGLGLVSDDNKDQRLPIALSRPIGFYLMEDVDLGGWATSCVVVNPKDDPSDGRLLRRKERFDAEDDCDLEHYFYE